MKKKIQKTQNKSKQQQNIKLNSAQLIKLMTAQKQKDSKNILDGMSFVKIPIYKITPEINQYLQKYQKERTVSFVQCNLTTLEGLTFDGSKVQHLRLDYNNLKGDCLEYIAKNFPNLISLILKHNQIENLEDLQHLKHLKKLDYLNLSFNPVKQYQDYKQIIFQHLPQLNNLDNEQDTDDSMADTSEDLILQNSEEDSESEASFDDYEESSEEDKKKKNTRKKVKK